MRRFLIRLVIIVALLVTMSILWIFCGRQLSLLVDKFKIIETASIPIKSLTYEGSGSGGILRINELALDLTPADPQALPPNIGTTKDEQIALSYGGKVFPFGPPKMGAESLTTEPQTGDNDFVSTRRSLLSWPTILEFNIIGRAPTWKRHQYYQLVWKKQSGAKLEMIWRYEQYCYSGDGWTSGMMTREGSTGLIRVEVSSPVPSPQSSP